MASPKKPFASSNTFAPDLSILGDTVTLHPSGYTETLQTPSTADAPTERNLVGNMARFRESPFDFLREISLYVSGSGWRSYDDVVGQPIFYEGFSENMKSAVMAQPMLRGKVAELAESRVQMEEREGLLAGEGRKGKRRREIEGQILEVVEKMTDDMICKMESKAFIRGAYYVVTQLLTRAYHQGIHVSSEEVLRLRSVAEQAAKEKHSIIFLPCHRSHVDYVSLHLICYRLGLAVPTVVAGDNLNFPLLGPFLQHTGAMWIRRSFSNDALYTTVVQAYIDTLLQKGHNFECFVEGGRSRTGKLLPPKFGILSFLLDSVLSGRVDDAIVCPVSTQYDKVIEVDSYISELLGQPKAKENLRDFLSASSVLSLKLGRVDVRFHAPWSLRAFLNEQQTRFSKMPQQLDIRESDERGVRVRLLRTLGYKVLSDINTVSVVMPTALIGTVLLTLRGRGVGKTELVRRVDWLSERVKGQGGRVAHFAGLPTSVVVDRGLEVLGPDLVGLVDGLPEPTYFAVDRFQLSFYRNMTIHLFVSEALVSAGLYSRVKQGGAPKNQRISYDDLLDQVSFLSQLFRGEFIFPTQGLAVNLDRTLHGLEADDIISITRAGPSEGPKSQGKIFDIGLSDAERAQGRENFDFYCFLIWPFIEASWLGAISLLMLTPPAPFVSPASTVQQEEAVLEADTAPWLDLRKVQDAAQLLGKTLYHQGDLSYFEAVNKETLKNAYVRFEEEGMLDVRQSRDKNVPALVRLAAEWTPKRDPDTGDVRPEGRLWEFAEGISQSRREGKNRRDGATVRGRVLRLVGLVGKALWENARAGGAEGEMSAVEAMGAGEEAGVDRAEAGRKRKKRRGRPIMDRARL